ncbi:MAG: DUF1330 domain-containing protein [Casimicrobiaceae bacterium]
MPAYMIVDVDIRDLARYEDYKRQVPALIARHGGEYLVRGGAHEVIEGDWAPTRMVLFRFPDRVAIKAFMDDPDYLPLAALRQEIATSRIIAVDGI